MTDRIVLRRSPGQVEVVAVVDGRLGDYALWRPGAPDGLGDLYRGRISKRVGALGGAFVSLGHEPDGLLPDRDARELAEGEAVLVRVTRSAQGGKGPRLTSVQDEAFEAGPPGLIRRGPSPLDELRDRHPDLPVVTADPSLAARRPIPDITLSATAATLEERVEEEIHGLRNASLELPGGARATITPTQALVAVDVDTSSGTQARAAKQTAQFALNRALLPRLLHELRLRNLSGAILIDFAGLQSAKRSLLRPLIEEALARDPLKPRLIGFTGLGLAEIVRARRRPPLHEQWSGAGQAYEAAEALRRAFREAGGARFALRTAPWLARVIEADELIGRDLAQETGHPLILRPDASLTIGWTIEEVIP